MGTQLALIEMEEQGATEFRRFDLPFLPPSKNVYESWQPMWRHQLRDKWYRVLEKKFDEYQFPLGCDQVGVAVRLVFASKRRRDWQNYAPLLLHVIPDALVRAGVIVDDCPPYFVVGPNGGIEFGVDTRPIAARLRNRTELSFAIRK